MQPSLIVILGPTASGKTALGIEVAQKIGGEVISADSRQIYRELNIGAAKPYLSSPFRRGDGGEVIIDGIPHHLVDIVNPDQSYSVADYQRDAMRVIADIHARRKVPVIVGGTGLYIQAVVDQLYIPKIPEDKTLRASLAQSIAARGIDALYLDLLKRDPAAKDVVQSKNPRRVIRALEVCMKTGEPFTSFLKKGNLPFPVFQIGIEWPRLELNERINRRVDEMMAAGLLDEVRSLGAKYGWELPSMSGHGYRQLGMHLRGELSLDVAVTLTKQETRQYAKRQMTWFKRDPRIQWFPRGEGALDMVQEVLKQKAPLLSG
ncbi:tRNA (adenosine(37)-N6)-dimethylallyltransferase MiaA [Candidatus Uhrbacteria bacterium]|nr:tRNA (adenosine(37)-N6)-dimethylallyltransferase MiaA [Candidatus Uhrbacteria bacterium]